ncbi:MAG TPA: O-antigen ligase family protein [Candidatus Dormibacteraeota bacterium]|nr:O-antigen ligase family protein [Candidatus Dormibacteraeota bacterium]
MNREAVARWCEIGILGLVLAILVFGPLAEGAVPVVPFLIVQGLTIGVMVLWAVRLWTTPQPQFLWPPICWAVLAFAIYAIGRYLTSDIEYFARQELIRVLIYAFLFFAIVNNLYRQERIQLISCVVILVAMVISFYAIYQYVTGSNRVWGTLTPYPHRGSGTYWCPNHLAGFLEMLLPLALALTLASRLKPLMKVFLGYSALVMLAGIAVSLSRGGWLATVLSLLVFFSVLSFRRGYRLPALLFLAVMLGGGALLIPKSHLFESRVKEITEHGGIDDDARFLLWGPAIQIWRENLVWGAGPAHFDARFRMYRPEKIQLDPSRVHNDFLNTVADWGIVGGVLVAGALGLLVWGLAKTWPFVRGSQGELGKLSHSNRYAFVLGGAVGLLALFFHSAVDFNMHIPANAILAVTLMAFVSSHLRFASDRYWVSARPWMQGIATFILFAGVVYLGMQEVRRGRETAWLAKASHAPAFSAEQVDLLKKAFAAEPMNPRTAFRIGDALKHQSQEGGEHYSDDLGTDYKARAQEAIDWFQRCAKLNKWDAYSLLGIGWCLDWLGKQAEAAPYFQKADALDPKSSYIAESMGFHFIETGNYAAAREWLERSVKLQWEDNPTPRIYLQIAQDRMLEGATNEFSRLLAQPR